MYLPWHHEIQHNDTQREFGLLHFYKTGVPKVAQLTNQSPNLVTLILILYVVFLNIVMLSNSVNSYGAVSFASSYVTFLSSSLDDVSPCAIFHVKVLNSSIIGKTIWFSSIPGNGHYLVLEHYLSTCEVLGHVLQTFYGRNLRIFVIP